MHSTINSKFVIIKQILWKMVWHKINNLIKNNDKVVIPLKHLSNFWRNLNIPLINCEVELILTWFKICVLIGKLTRDTDYDAPIDRKIGIPENAIFKKKWYKTFVTIKIRI